MDVLEQPTARSTDPITSLAAADGVTVHAITECQTAILEALAGGPMTHDDLILAVRAMGVMRSPQRIRSSCSELVKAGLVRDTGEEGRSMYGRRAVKWGRVDET